MGSGPAIVLLHGFPESGTLWRFVWDQLAESNTLIIPDLPGSGDSILDKNLTISEMSDCIKAILDKENINKVVFAGHSMGGYTGFAFANKYPGSLAGLSVVHSSPLADDDEKKINRKKVIEVVRKGAREAFLRQMVPGLFAPDFLLSCPAAVEEQVNNSLKMAKESIINFYTAIMDRDDSTHVLDNAPFPVQWILGKEDTIVQLDKILHYCSVAPVNFVSVYEHAGHMSMVEAPEQLAKDIKTFANYCYNK